MNLKHSKHKQQIKWMIFLSYGLNSPELKRIEFTLSRMNHEASVCQLKSLLLQKGFFFWG